MCYGRTARYLDNLQKNWFLPVTALAFFSLTLTRELYNIGSLVVTVIMFVLAALLSDRDLLAVCRHAAPWYHILAGGTALCLSIQMAPPFYAYWFGAGRRGLCYTMAAAAVGFVFVYLCTVLLWLELVQIAQRTGLLRGISRGEWILYAVLFLLSLLFVTVAFSRSQAFYGTEHEVDIIYISDSPYLVKNNVYLNLYHTENDIRQPLFAVFSAPFLAVPKLLARMLGATPAVEAMLLDYVQVAMLLAANFMLARMMELDRGARACFMVLGCCTYMYMLFIVMMEQYIVACFWLVLCLYTICKEGRPARLALWGAGGTLLSSLALLLFSPRKKPWQSFGGWLTGVLRGGLEFLAVMLAFKRLDIILSLKAKLGYLLRSFGGGAAVSLTDKVLQYTAFCAECFFAPETFVQAIADDGGIWRQAPVTQIQWAGVAIFVLAIVGAFLCWDKKICRLSAFWIALSLAVLVGFGWGTRENGLILYTLYFGWAYMVLLFQMVVKITDRLRLRKVFYAIAVLAAAAMVAVNVPSMKALIDFAVQYYPV